MTDNLVIDPTFEDVTVGRNEWWDPDGGSGYSTEQARSGTHSIKLVEGPAGWDGFDLLPTAASPGTPALDVSFQVIPGQTHYAEIWVYPTTSVGHIDFGVVFRDSTVVTPDSPYTTWGLAYGDNTFIPTPPANTWTKLSGRITVPAGYDWMEVWFEVVDDALGLVVYVDDPVVLQVVPTVQRDPRDWTQFDPNLRIVEHSNETMHIVVVTHLPTGIQQTCGKYPHQAQNRAGAIELLKMRVVGQ